MNLKNIFTGIPRPGDPLFVLYLSNILAIGFSVLTNFAWGHWVSTSDFNSIQLIIRYAAIIGFFALPGMNEASGLAAGAGDLKTAFLGLGLRIAFYSLIAFGCTLIAASSSITILPGLSDMGTTNLLWYAPAIIVPSFAIGVFLASRDSLWAALTRTLSAAFPVLILGVLFLSGKKENIAPLYLAGLGILSLLLLLPVLGVNSPEKQSKTGLLRYGFQTSVIRWPEFLLSMEIFILAAYLPPLSLTLFFLADRVNDHIKSFISNNFAHAFGKYSRLKSNVEIESEMRLDFKKSAQTVWYQIGVILLVIPLGLIMWRSDYWGAIPLAIGLVALVFMGTPHTFVRFGLIACKNKRYQSAHALIYPVTYIFVLLILVPKFGLWGVFAAKVYGALLGMFLAWHFGLRRRGKNFDIVPNS